MTDDTNSENPLLAYFEANTGRLVDKWMHYFDAYHRHFARFRGRPITVMEIGVYQGGSLEMWRHYFGPQARIVGVDIDPRCAQFAAPGIEIVIGDQGDRAFLAQLRERFPRVDVLIDDGGHTMGQQLATIEELYRTVADDGVFLCEDLHTSYWNEFGGGYRHRGNFIEYCKDLVDHLNAWHSRDPHSFRPSDYSRSMASLHFYDSIAVIEKTPRSAPTRRQTGVRTFT